MNQYRAYTFLALLTISGLAYSQTSPFDQSPSENVNNQIEGGYITKEELNQEIKWLRMEMDTQMMEINMMNEQLPLPNSSSFMGSLGQLTDDAKTRIIINGKELKRDSEKYSDLH